MVALQQRTGSWSNANFGEETAFDSDAGITATYKLPLSGPSSVAIGQGLISVPIFKGDRRPMAKVLGPITVAGKLPLNLDFLTFLRILVVAMGRGNYSRPLGGTSSVHRVLIPTSSGSIPGSFQLEHVFQENTQVVQRMRACRASAINFNLGTSGPALYDVDVIGIGDIVSSAATLFTPTDDGLVPATYYNGQMNYKGQVAVVDLNALTLNLMMNVTRTEGFATGGLGLSLPTGNVEPKGTVKFAMTISGTNPGADLNAWNDAIAGNEVLIECYVTDQPISGASGVFPRKYIRIKMPTCRMGAAAPMPGGMAGLFVQQPFEAARSVAPSTAASSVAAEMFSPTGGPYLIGAATFNLGVKIDGGATVTVALTQGAARTAAQIVADLNGAGSFAALAVADVFMGNLVRITSKQTAGNFGALSSVAIDTAVATPAHAAFGWTTTVAIPGVSNCELYMEVWNALGANV